MSYAARNAAIFAMSGAMTSSAVSRSYCACMFNQNAGLVEVLAEPQSSVGCDRRLLTGQALDAGPRDAQGGRQ